MNGDRNMVQKPKREEYMDEEDEIEIELEEDDDNDNASSSKSAFSDNDPKKRLFLFMAFIVGGTVVLLLFLYICSLFTHKTYEYEDIETIMKNAAIQYFKENPADLPQQENMIVELPVENMVAAEKMKELTEYTKEGEVCSGSVRVQKVGEEYIYTPLLNCGENYTTTELFNKVKADNQIVTTGYGLYNINGNYIFRGEKVNNYVQLDNSMWRIIKITTNNQIVLLKDENLKASKPWDDRYNNDKSYSSGINNYTTSRIKELLDAMYKGTYLEDDKEDFLSNNDKTKLATFDVCYGKRAPSNETNNNSEECKSVVNNQYIGLLTLSDYIMASVDPSCKNANSMTCQNYNYLVSDKNWWLLTANSDNTMQAYKVEYEGTMISSMTSSYSGVRPVIHLSDKVYFKSGKGTKDKPYIIK